MEYSELNFTINPCNDSTREILAAELNELGFEGFIETDAGFTTFIISGELNISAANSLLLQLRQNNIDVSFEVNSILQQNWNSEWEKNSTPVKINDTCTIKAPFHGDTPKTKYELIIQPDMTFGTGHHETTQLMISEMLIMDFHEKCVLDMGCGTGVLAILASKLGAKNITAADIDNRAFENTLENIKLNSISNVQVVSATSKLTEKTFDIILANITKNIIISNAKKFTEMLDCKGVLICSGFFEDDLSEIEIELKISGLNLTYKQIKNNWIVARFIKQ